ncbi:18751_t:CDS:2, partial [Dentiscutata erythropus]
MPVKSCKVAVLGFGMMTMKVKFDENDDFTDCQKDLKEENNLEAAMMKKEGRKN